MSGSFTVSCVLLSNSRLPRLSTVTDAVHITVAAIKRAEKVAFINIVLYLLLKRVSWPQMEEKSLQTQQVGKRCCNKALFSLLCSKSENCSGLYKRTNSLLPRNRKNWDIHQPDVDNCSGCPRKTTKIRFLRTINLQAIMAIVYCFALSLYLVLSLCSEWFWKKDLSLFQELWDFCLFWLPKGYTAPNTFYFFKTSGQSSREMLWRTFLVKSDL